MSYTYMSPENYLVFCHEEPINDPDLIEIDENIAFPVSELNKKGYKTEFCCEGHFENYISKQMKEELKTYPQLAFSVGSMPYICFKPGIHIPSCPKGWYIEEEDEILEFNDEDDDEGHFVPGYRVSITSDIPVDENNPIGFYHDKFNAIITLMNWVESL